MAGTVNKLSAAFVIRNTVIGRKGDGGGLYLQTSRIGKRVTKAWLFRFALHGRPREMGLGGIGTWTLAEAREKARECRRLLDRGIDPIEHRRAQRATERAATAKRLTFAEAAAAFITDNRAGWRSADHAAQWDTSLRDYVLPTLGALPVAAIETAHVVRTLRPIWQEKPETASRVRGRIAAILDWAAAGGFRTGENPARWQGHLENILPKRRALASVRHHAAMPLDEIPAFAARLAATPSMVARAIEVLLLTATRLGEVLGARWGEIDLEAALWVIPASRTKANREHRVPLSRRTVAVLCALPGPQAGPLVFPSVNSPHKPIAVTSLHRVLDAGRGEAKATLHGFRSTFRDWAGDHADAPREIAEAALGHKVGDRAEQAYRRGDALQKRRALMEDWSRFCYGP
jgi:integrase